MKEQSLFKNYIYNLIKTLCGVVLPIITFSYTSRVLGVDGIGRINFIKSFINYFVIIALLGINQYGIREVAKCKLDRDALSDFIKEILSINLITTLMAYALLLTIVVIKKSFFSDYRDLLVIYSAIIILSSMGVEWLYQGLEEYRYITIRAVAFQVFALLLMFVFVRSETDIDKYAVINVISTSGMFVINFIKSKKYLRKGHNRLRFLRHIKPMLWMFFMAVSVTLYTVLDTTMLGVMKGDKAVGLYSAAIKMNNIVISVISALGTVLIPRFSYYVGINDHKKFDDLLDKGYNYMLLLAVPSSVGLFMLSDDIIQLFSGNGFVAAGITMRIMSAVVLLIPFSVMTNNQIFVPLGKERTVFYTTNIGALTNMTSNLFLIPHFAENGAAVGTVIAESAVAVISLYNASKLFDMKKAFSKLYQYCISSVAVGVCIFVLQKVVDVHWLRTIVSIMASVIVYFCVLALFRNRYFIDVLNRILSTINTKGDVT